MITLDNAYQSELMLLPARNSAGELKGLEVLVNFTGVKISGRHDVFNLPEHVSLPAG